MSDASLDPTTAEVRVRTSTSGGGLGQALGQRRLDEGQAQAQEAPDAPPYWAVILDISKDEPSYHAYARRYSDLTVCGRVISTGRVGIPAKHAKKFARKCRSCFPPTPPQKETLF